MSTKVKVGIAAVIVAALVSLIVLDQGTAPKTETGTPAPGEAALPVRSPDQGARLVSNEAEEIQIFNEMQRTMKKPGTAGPAPAGKAPIKAEPADNTKEIKPVTAPVPATATPEEYVIKQGDTLETIAFEKLGDRKRWTEIAKANPNVNPNKLGVGKKIVIPSRTEKPAEPSRATEEAVVIDASSGRQTYVVQPGDSLTKISKKVYNTTLHAGKIAEANGLDDLHAIQAGMKLALPDLPRRESANTAPVAGAGQVATAAPAGQVHQVQQGENLWKIAEKYAKGRDLYQVIESIVKANADKLKDDKSMLRLGWQLVIPE